MRFSYKFPAVRGIQAGREYYISMVPLRMINKIFTEDDDCLPPEYRSQRKLNQIRIPGIRQYILDNRDSYVFSALAASIDGDYKFEMIDSNDIGFLEVSMDARFLINDGQHRKAALLEAIQEDESLLNETISVVFYEDRGLEKSQQMFTDFNKYAVRTSNSLAVLYDGRDPLAVVTRSVISKISFLDEYTDKETDNLGKLSHCFFTLNTFYKANRFIVGQEDPEIMSTFLYDYWRLVVDNMVLWQEVTQKTIGVGVLKQQYIVTQGIVIQALGRLGNSLKNQSSLKLEKVLSGIQKINWRRNSPCWKGRAVRDDGRIITNNKASILICAKIKHELGLELSEEEKYEEEFLKKKG